MWKLIVIYLSKHEIIEADEFKTREQFNLCEYNPFVMFAFLYNERGNLEETYIASADGRKLKR